MASLDPNWFYSSLAQSAAAIVGIVGGFIVSALLNQRRQAADHRLTLLRHGQTTRAELVHLLRVRAQFLEWYTKHIKHLRGGGERVEFHGIPAWSGGLSNRKTLIEWSPNAEELERMRVIAERSEELQTNYQLSGIDSLLIAAPATRQQHLDWLDAAIAEHRRAGEGWQPSNNALLELSAGTGRIGDFRGALNNYFSTLGAAEEVAVPRLYYWAVALLGFLSVVGVIIPLAQLSAFDAAHKVVLLTLFGVAMLSLVLFVFAQIDEIRSLLHVRAADLDKPVLVPN